MVPGDDAVVVESHWVGNGIAISDGWSLRKLLVETITDGAAAFDEYFVADIVLVDAGTAVLMMLSVACI